LKTKGLVWLGVMLRGGLHPLRVLGGRKNNPRDGKKRRETEQTRGWVKTRRMEKGDRHRHDWNNKASCIY